MARTQVRQNTAGCIVQAASAFAIATGVVLGVFTFLGLNL